MKKENYRLLIGGVVVSVLLFSGAFITLALIIKDKQKEYKFKSSKDLIGLTNEQVIERLGVPPKSIQVGVGSWFPSGTVWVYPNYFGDTHMLLEFSQDNYHLYVISVKRVNRQFIITQYNEDVGE